MHPATVKIYVLQEYIGRSQDGVLVFLDADAWIQNPEYLFYIISKLVNDSSKHGAFSRDPYKARNTFINSGSFILKVNEFTKKMYQTLVNDLQNDISHHNKRPWDQYYISNFVHKNRAHFIIFSPEILNSPTGKVLRHYWWKNKFMYTELLQYMNSSMESSTIKFELDYDTQSWPNSQRRDHANEHARRSVLAA